jgi:uncharacterized protein
MKRMTIARLFGKSPFSPLQSHMKKVGICIKKLTEVFAVLKSDKREKIDTLVKELSKLEYEADLTKNDIRNHLPKSLFIPIDRSHLLEILSIQDSIADHAEEIGSLLAIQKLDDLKQFGKSLQELYKKNCDAFWHTRQIIKEFDELLESSFGGMEAQKVKELVDETSRKKYEADLFRRSFVKEFFQNAGDMSAPNFHLWMRIIDEIGAISNISEKLANRIRMILELK